MKQQRRQKGFTTVELLLSMVILTILASISLVGVTRYQKSLRQVEADGIAKEIFVAAQNHLTMAQGQGLPAQKDDPGFEESAGEEGVYYYIVNRGAGLGPDDSNSVLSLMLPYAAIDESVRKGGSYIIRYQRDSGLILDVFYAADFSFLPEDYERLLALRPEDGDGHQAERRSFAGGSGKTAVVGYYGGVKAAGTMRGEALAAPEVLVINDERLVVRVSNPNVDNPEAALKLVITGKSGGRSELPLLLGKDAEKPVGFVDYSDPSGRAGKSFTVVLDDPSADIHFSSLFASAGFYPGDDLSIRAVAYSNTAFTNVAESVEKTANSLFAEVVDTIDSVSGGTVKCALISNLRHFENLSNAVSGVNASFCPLRITRALQTTDLSWSEYLTAVVNAHGGGESGEVRIGTLKKTHSAAGSFLPVEALCALSYDGGGYSISDLVIRGTADFPNAGLFATLEGGTVRNLRILNADVSSGYGPAGALAAVMTDSSASLVLVCNDTQSDDSALGVTGSRSAGGLAGTLSGGRIDACAAAVYVRADGGSAGGLIGSTSGGVTITNSYSGGHTVGARYLDMSAGAGRYNVSAATAAGGLVGDAALSTLSLRDCYSTCSVSGKSAAGGLIGAGGQSGSTVSSAYATGRVSAPSAETAGALIGTLNGTAFSGSNYYLNNVSDGISAAVIANVTGVSAQDTDQTDFILPEAERDAAFAYDRALLTTYKGKYCFPTIRRLNPNAPESSFTTRHYGDWQVPGMSALPYALKNEDSLRLEITPQGDGPLTFAIAGKESGNIRVFRMEKKKNSATLTKEGRVEGNKIVWEQAVVTNLPVALSGELIRVTLDDITVPGAHFAQLLGNRDALGEHALIPGEDLTVYLGAGECSWSELRTIQEPPTENSLFARGESGIATANIGFLRHLQNLDPVISAVTERVTGAKLVRSISAGGAFDGGGAYAAIYSADGEQQLTGSFYGIFNPSLTRFDGDNLTIRGLTINGAPEALSADGAGNAGLFRLVKTGLMIRNLKLQNCAVTADSGHAGSFVAELSGRMLRGDTLLAVAGADREVRAEAPGAAAGGLFGRVDGSLMLHNSAAAVLVRADADAGGLVGSVSGQILSIQDCYTGGHTGTGGSTGYYDVGAPEDYNVLSRNGCAGGLVGSMDTTSPGTITRSFSAASVAAQSGKSAGGVLGTSRTNLDMDTVYTVAPVYGVPVGEEAGSSASGAFVGKLGPGASVSNTKTFYLPEVYLTDNHVAVAYEGGNSTNDPAASHLAQAVQPSYYDRDDGGNIISARSNSANMQVRTYPYDGASLSGREYPFLIYTVFSFDSRAYRSFYGDWQPALTPASVTHSASFTYVDPVSGAENPVPDERLRVQQVHEHQLNALLPPDLPEITGYELDCWEVKKGGAVVKTIAGSNRRLSIEPALSDADLTITALFKRIDGRFTVTFWYDKSGSNMSFERIGDAQILEAPAVMSQVRVPARNIGGYQFKGWYDNPNFSGAPLDFTSSKPINNDISAYGKYEKIDYYTITVDFMYETAEGETGHLKNVPRYRIQDAPQYKLQQAKGLPFEADVVLPKLDESMTLSRVVCLTYDKTTGAQIETIDNERAAFNSEGTTLHINTDEQHALHFIVFYSGEGDNLVPYQIVYRLHDTASNGSYLSGSVRLYKPYDDKEFVAMAGSVPDVRPQSGADNSVLEGFAYPKSSDITGAPLKKTQTPDYAHGENVIYVDYYRKLYTLSFNSRAGTYVEPVRLYYGQPMQNGKPANPMRTGYEFTKWTLTKKGDDSVTYQWSDGMPAANVEAVAHWASGTSQYTVIYWRQKVTDDRYTPSGERTYDYAELVHRSGTTDTLAKLDPSDKTKAGRGEYVGFHYNDDASDTAGVTIAADGSTTLNVYYDRNVITINFEGLGASYEPTDEKDSVFGMVNGKYVPLTRRGSDDNPFWTYNEGSGESYIPVPGSTDARYGLVDGSYVTLTQRDGAWYYEGGEDVYTSTTGTSASAYYGTDDGETYFPITPASRTVYNWQYKYKYTSTTQSSYFSTYYGLLDSGEYVELTRHSGFLGFGVYYTYGSNKDYEGTRYERAASTAAYEGTAYKATGSDGSRRFTETTYTNSGTTYYGRDANGGFVELTRKGTTQSYWTRSDGTEYSGTRYLRSKAMVEYSGERYLRASIYTGTRYNQIGSPYVGLYGQPFSQYRYNWPEGPWKDRSDGVVMTFLGEFILPTQTDTTATFYKSGSASRFFYFFLQEEDGSYLTVPSDIGYGSSGNSFNVTEKYEGFQAASYAFTSNKTFDGLTWTPTAKGASISIPTNRNLCIRYERRQYDLSVQNALNNQAVFPATTVKYGVPLRDYIPKTTPTPTDQQLADGYAWDGKWYEDEACTKEFDWEKESMPANNRRVFVQFVLPSYDVNLELRDPAPEDGSPATYLSTPPNTPYSFRVVQNKTLPISNAAGDLMDEYHPTKPGWAFEGWYYMDGATEKPFNISQGIQSDLTIYAKWSAGVSSAVEDITVRYVTADYDPVAGTGMVLAPPRVIDGCHVGAPWTEEALEFEGYYPEYMYMTITVMEDGENEIVFRYVPIDAWRYEVRYVARYRSYATLRESDPLRIGLSEQSLDYTIKVEEHSAFNQYELVSFTLPAGYESYHMDHYEYRGSSGTADTITISPAEGTQGDVQAVVTCYIEPDPSRIDVGDRYATYDGSSQALASEEAVGVLTLPEELNGTVTNRYFYVDENGTVLSDDAVRDVGTYRMYAYVVLTVTNPDTHEEQNYLLGKLTDGDRYVRILRRTVTITSGSAVGTFQPDDPQPLTCSAVTYGGDGFVEGEGVQILFAVDAFRQYIGTSDNVFTYEPLPGTNLSNYDISVAYGTLRVAVETDWTEDAMQTHYYVVDAAGEGEGYELVFHKREAFFAARPMDDYTEQTPAPWANEPDDVFAEIRSVELGDIYTSIGSRAFAGFAKLEGMVLPESIEAIGIDAYLDSGITALFHEDGETAFTSEELAALCPAPEGDLPEGMSETQARLRSVFRGTPLYKALYGEELPEQEPPEENGGDGAP